MLMADGGKPLPKSLSTISSVKDHTHKRNDNHSKPVLSKHAGRDHNVSKLNESPSSKHIISKTGLNSGTPCISMAFTPSGKPSAISTVKYAAEHKNLLSTMHVNGSKLSLSSSSKSKREFNSGTPCISKAFTPLGKSPAIRTVKEGDHTSLKKSSASAINRVDFVPRTVTHNSKPPQLKNISSETIHQSDIRYFTALRKPFEGSGNNLKSETILRETFEKISVDTKPPSSPAVATTSRTVDQIRKYYTPRKSYPSETLSDSKRDLAGKTLQATTSSTEYQNVLRNFYTPRKSYPCETLPDNRRPFDGKKLQGPGSIHVPPKTNHGSTTVDLLRCIICIDKERDTVFQPCGHLIVCNNCAKDMESTCPMCRKRIKKKIRAYIN